MKHKNELKIVGLVITAWLTLLGFWFIVYTLFSLS